MSLHPFRGVQSPITISYFEEGHYEFNFQLMPCCLLQTSSLFQHKLYMQENWHLLLNISAWSYRINIISRELRRRRDTPKREYLKNEAGTTRCELPKKFLPKGQIISKDVQNFLWCFFTQKWMQNWSWLYFWFNFQTIFLISDFQTYKNMFFNTHCYVAALRLLLQRCGLRRSRMLRFPAAARQNTRCSLAYTAFYYPLSAAAKGVECKDLCLSSL